MPTYEFEVLFDAKNDEEAEYIAAKLNDFFNQAFNVPAEQEDDYYLHRVLVGTYAAPKDNPPIGKSTQWNGG